MAEEVPIGKSFAHLLRIFNPKPSQSRRQVVITLLSSLAAVLLALLLATFILWISGERPFSVFDKMWENATDSAKLYEMLDRSTPMMVSAVAVAVGFKMNLFNIGVEGQYLVGVFFAAVVASRLDTWAPLHVLIIFAVGMTAGSIWASIAAILKVKRGVNEVIVTIMLNQLALNLIDFLFSEYFRFTKPGGSLDVKTKPIPRSGWLPDLVQGKLGSFFLMGLIVVLLYWLLVFKSRFGFRLRASGLNAGAARTGGIASNRMIVASMLISGAVAGLIGMNYLLADSHAYGPSRPEGFGFSGIAVALLGRNHPAGIVGAAFLFSFLDTLNGPLQIDKVPQSIVMVIKAVILLAVVIVNEVVAVRVARRTADRTAAQLAVAGAAS
ncbi:MAG: ABC transporter permease [Actinomycetota bacterium]|nr:ABC transporter permease [Actinomycetota bacterium]